MGIVQHLIEKNQFFSKIAVGHPACGETPYLRLRLFQKVMFEFVCVWLNDFRLSFRISFKLLCQSIGLWVESFQFSSPICY
jgi:hypothetical protein